MEFENLYNTIELIGNQVKDKYKDNLKRGDHIATGKLFNSINYKLEVTESGCKLYFVALDYWINIENGQKKGKMPPINVIQKWMVAKNIPGGKKVAYLISRKIFKKGTKANPYLRDIQKGIPNYKAEIMDAIAKDIKVELDKIKIKNALRNGNNTK
jgi:hypothetical protein